MSVAFGSPVCLIIFGLLVAIDKARDEPVERNTRAALEEMRAIEDRLSTADESEAESNVLQAISEQSDDTLTIDRLDEFVRSFVDLSAWEDLAVSCGAALWLSPEHYYGQYGIKFEALHTLLSAVQITRIGHATNAFLDLKSGARDNLVSFIAQCRANGHSFAAVAEDVLVVLLSMQYKQRIPDGFNWGDFYVDPMLAALRRCCEKA